MKLKSIHQKFVFYLGLFGFLLVSTSLNAFFPEPDENKTLFNSLKSESIIEITLETDLTQLIEDKDKELYQKARFTYRDNLGNRVNRKIKVRARGKYRKRVCDLPPMKLKFSKNELLAEGLSDNNKLKLVTHCLEDNPEEAEENLLKEFLTYKILNTLTDKSYKVQLVKITYINTKDNSKKERYGFIIETTKGLSKRINGVSKKLYNLPMNDLERDQYNTVAMFQYMISNTDWEVTKARNVRTILPNAGNKVTLIPYDFDFAGLVNTKYATINPNFPITSLRDRVFLGNFKNEEDLKNTLDLFKSKKLEIINIVQNFEPLNKKARRDVVNFLKSYFKIIENDKLIKEEFLENKFGEVNH